MRSFVAFALVAAVVFALPSIDLDFLEGFNFTKAATDFAYRFTSADAYSPAFGTFYTWRSTSVDPITASSSMKASANAMIGVGALPGSLCVPFAVLAYATGEAAVNTNALSFAGVLISAKPKLDAVFEGGVIAMAALDMQEYDPNGKAVGKPIPFTLPIFSSGATEEEVTGDDGNVKGLTRTFTPAGTTAEVTVTYVTAKKAGVLKYGLTPVSPRSYEMVIEIKNFPLTDKKNHVRMNVAFLSAIGSATVKGRGIVLPRLGQEDIYTAALDHAIVDGDRVEVEVNLEVAPADVGYLTTAVLNAALGPNFDAQIAHIDFPAGASNIIYDPVIGAGANIYDALDGDGSSSSSTASSGTPASSGTSASSGTPASSHTPAPSSTHGSAATAALSLLVALVCVFFYLF